MMTPTPEQLAIIDAAQNSTDNLIISALAGAAKTSTLVLLSAALAETSILCLAFNKRIADEMTTRLAPNCKAMTLNSLGHRIWADAAGRRLVLDKDKSYGILRRIIDTLSGTEKNEAYADFADTQRAISFGKSYGYVPTGHFPNARGLMNDESFFAHLPDEPTALQERLIRETSIESIKQALSGKIDFDDQILMPTIFSAPFPSFPLIMVDEAQDLSALNHAFLKKLVKKRIIAVGDECQAIYGFRGAHQDSMPLLRDTFSMRQFVLSISFRCPISVVEAARWRAPHMAWPDWAKPGEVRSLSEWTIPDLPDSASIICRNNAPLFKLAVLLLRNKRNPQIIGNDIGANLLKIMRKFGDSATVKADAEHALGLWLAARLSRTREKGKALDQAACIQIFLDQGETLGDAIAYAEHIFAMRGPIQLMTGHKAKGLEYDDVFILDKHLVNMEEQQDQNLFYVMQTRAKERLTYFETGGFVGKQKT